ncbi:hypothetical protein F7725_001598, partial [Dissostichus mawsoni]
HPVLPVCGPSFVFHQHPVLPVCGPSFVFHQHPVLPVCGPSFVFHQHPVLPVCGPSFVFHQHPVLPVCGPYIDSVTSIHQHPDLTTIHLSHDCVVPDNIEGYGAVQELAEFFLVSENTYWPLVETMRQISIWQALGDFDKRKTSYPPLTKHTEAGRFRATKKIVAPGVESTKRFVLHWGSQSAQWRDCNRVVEAIFTRLCGLYKNTVRCEGKRVSRFTMVIRAYKHIRECVITNAKVMTETTIQLPEVNVATVTQWFSRRCRSQEQQILKQGIPAPDAPMAGPEQLLWQCRRDISVSWQFGWASHFVLPPNTAGEAKLQKRSQPVAISQVPPPPPYYALPFLAPTPPFSDDASQHAIGISYSALTSSQSNVPYTTQQYRKIKEEREQSGSGKRK